MGDMEVDIFLGTLKNLITDSKINYIKDKKHQLESLAEDVKYLREFLKLTQKKRKEHPEVMDLVMRIRDVVSETEDIVELFVVRVFKADHSSEDDLSLDLESVKKEIKTLGVEVKGILDKDLYDINGGAVIKRKHSSAEIEGGPSSSRGRDTNKVGEEREVVGFKDEVTTLMGKLHCNGDVRNLEIISIIGAGGAGKTTLAREVYDDPLTLQKFDIRAWVNVSQDYNKTMKRDLLISILKLASPKDHQDYMKIKEDEEDKLGEIVNKCLKGKKYLVVMDDIWGLEAWNDIQRSFPREHKESKVIFTSRQPYQPDGVGYIHHFINPLPDSCSWELLRHKVFKKGQCPPELVDIGMQIAEKCTGLPLAIIAVAGILATEDKTINVWQEVAEHLSSIISKNQKGIMEILELSYNHLPLHLKACFLYINGVHQEDYEIPVKKLIWLLTAEGFVHQTDGGKSLEAIAKDYLVNLIERNLIMVTRKDWVGRIKACRIHDLLRELCLTTGKEDNFFVQNYDDGSFSHVTNKHRRLFIGNQLLFDKFCSSSHAGNLRSFFCSEFKEAIVFKQRKQRRELSLFAKSFKLLRVLHMISFTNIGELRKGDLFHLRYLAALALDFAANGGRSIKDFTQIFCNLSNLETLEVDYWWRGILLPVDVFKMVRLRNLYSLRGWYTFHHSFKGERVEKLCSYFEDRRNGLLRCCDDEGDNYDDEGEENKMESLQFLHSICNCEDCLRFLKRAPNLRDLRMVNKEHPIYGSRLYNLEFLNCLEIFYFYGQGNCRIDEVELKLPPTITRLSLSSMRMKSEHLTILLQTLPSLEVLKLHKITNMVEVWNTSELEEMVSQLKYLKLSHLYIIGWSASEDHFPSLEVLEIDHCPYLSNIPNEFANLHELRQITVRYSSMYAEKSARDIQEEQKFTRGDDACLNLVAECNEWCTSQCPYPSSSGYSSDSSMD